MSSSRHWLQFNGQLHIQAALHPEKELLVPIELEVGWAAEPVRTTRRSEKILTLPELELRTLGRPARIHSLYGLSIAAHKTRHGMG
jgi:hypothetical protein